MSNSAATKGAKTIWQLIKATAVGWQNSQTSVLAASLAYFTVFSIAPLMTLVIMVVGLVYGESAVEGELVGQLEQIVGSDAAQVMQTAIADLRESQSGGLLGLLFSFGFIAFGAYNVFMQIQYSLNKIWRIRPEPTLHMARFIRKRIVTFVMVFVVVLLVFASFLANTVMSTLVSILSNTLPDAFPVWRITSFTVTLVMLTLIFSLIYTILPDAKVHWRDALVGASLTTWLFMVGQVIFWQLLSRTEFGSAYGVASSFVILITWIYCAAHIFFVGAEFTRVYAERLGNAIIPEPHAVSSDAQLDGR
ncbi:MAG: YihY/virulence factor BrkB family protein [Leptolyngbya sp. LCM1.Bin17]|nr:MAG: YihY/virulence factor BrkB family protein [Leptolyngbya sp. LCM1.Bin17]